MDLVFLIYDLFPKNAYFRLGLGLVKNPIFFCNYLWHCNGPGSEFWTRDIFSCFGSGFLTSISASLYKTICSKSDKITHIAEANPEERALIPNVMQPSPRYTIKRDKIDNKRAIHSLIMKEKDKEQSSSREEPPYTM